WSTDPPQGLVLPDERRAAALARHIDKWWRIGLIATTTEPFWPGRFATTSNPPRHYDNASSAFLPALADPYKLDLPEEGCTDYVPRAGSPRCGLAPFAGEKAFCVSDEAPRVRWSAHLRAVHQTSC